jgi:hypothetical protein
LEHRAPAVSLRLASLMRCIKTGGLWALHRFRLGGPGEVRGRGRIASSADAAARRFAAPAGTRNSRRSRSSAHLDGKVTPWTCVLRPGPWPGWQCNLPDGFRRNLQRTTVSELPASHGSSSVASPFLVLLTWILLHLRSFFCSLDATIVLSLSLSPSLLLLCLLLSGTLGVLGFFSCPSPILIPWLGEAELRETWKHLLSYTSPYPPARCWLHSSLNTWHIEHLSNGSE